VIPGDVASWGRRQNSQLFKKFYTREYDMGGAISPSGEARRMRPSASSLNLCVAVGGRMI